VLVLLTDNTIGRVQSITDPRVAQLSALIAGVDVPEAAAAAPAARPPPPAAGKTVLKPLRLAGAGHRLRRSSGDAAARELERALGGGASACASPSAAAAAGRDDLALWREFAGLEAAHGEALCGAILEGCGNDFEAAIRTICGQAAAAGVSGSGAAAAAAAPPAQEARAAPAALAPAAAGAGAGVAGLAQEVRMLAEAFCVPPAAALQLCDMMAGADPAAAVEALAAAKGDVNAAAEALLLGPGAGGSGAAAAAAPATASKAGAAAADGELSEADQMAMLRAMGVLRDEPARRGRRTPPRSPRGPAPVAPPPVPQWGPAQSATAEDVDFWGSALAAPPPAAPAAAPAAPAAPAMVPAQVPAHVRLLAPPPRTHEAPSAEGWAPPARGRAAPGAPPPRSTAAPNDEAGLSMEQLRAKAGRLRAEADAHFKSSRLLLMTAQDAIRSGNEPKFAEYVRKHKEEGAKGKRLMAEVNRLAMRWVPCWGFAVCLRGFAVCLRRALAPTPAPAALASSASFTPLLPPRAARATSTSATCGCATSTARRARTPSRACPSTSPRSSRSSAAAAPCFASSRARASTARRACRSCAARCGPARARGAGASWGCVAPLSSSLLLLPHVRLPSRAFANPARHPAPPPRPNCSPLRCCST
jgi:hypothetical protein